MATAHFKGNDSGFETENVGDYISLDSDEIQIPAEAIESRIDALRSVVADYISFNESLKDYSIAVFEHVLMISKQVSLEKIVLSCDMCSFVALHDEELRVHKTSHGIF